MTQLNSSQHNCTLCNSSGLVLAENTDKTKLVTYKCSCPAAASYPDYIKKWEYATGHGLKLVNQF